MLNSRWGRLRPTVVMLVASMSFVAAAEEEIADPPMTDAAPVAATTDDGTTTATNAEEAPAETTAEDTTVAATGEASTQPPGAPKPKIGTQSVDTPDTGESLKGFHFAPALFVLTYDEEVLEDSKDTRIRSDDTLEAYGTETTTALGFEVHYNFYCWRTPSKVGWGPTTETAVYTSSWGITCSPFLGFFDIDDGIKGYIVGLLFGGWRGDENFNNKVALNVGVGWMRHNDQLVLADDVKEGSVPPEGLLSEDYTTRDNVDGWAIMITAALGF